MSAGPRIPLERIPACEAWCRRAWGLDPATCDLVGSARRRRPEVGDIEFTAPLPTEGAKDELYERILSTCQAEGLFSETTADRPCRAEKGLSPGFAYCRVVARGESGLEVPIEINRYVAAEPSNRGWITLMKTGPADYGRWFLGQWKRTWEIPPSEQASRDGMLVDAYGKPFHVPTEEQAFRLCRIAYLPPEARDGYVEALRAKGWS